MADYQPTLSNWPNLAKAGLGIDFNQSTIATHEVVPAIAGRQIRLLSVDFIVNGAQVLTWKSAADSIKGGAFEFTGPGFLNLGPHLGHYIETRSGEALNLDLSAAVKVRGPVAYQVI